MDLGFRSLLTGRCQTQRVMPFSTEREAEAGEEEDEYLDRFVDMPVADIVRRRVILKPPKSPFGSLPFEIACVPQQNCCNQQLHSPSCQRSMHYERAAGIRNGAAQNGRNR